MKVYDPKIINRHGDYCDNCGDKWPCRCKVPIMACGICGNVMYECRCTERDINIHGLVDQDIR